MAKDGTKKEARKTQIGLVFFAKASSGVSFLKKGPPLLLHNLYYNYKFKGLNLSWGQEKYENLINMKNPSSSDPSTSYIVHIGDL